MREEVTKKLCLADGASGYEKEVTRVMKEIFNDCVDEIQYDNIGSIVGIKKGKTDLKVLLTGHVDEIGMIVKSIDEKGYVHPHQLGTLFAHSLGAQEVTLTTREGKKLKGIIGTHAKNPGFQLNKDVIPVQDLIIDFGVYSKQELVDLGVRIGDPITPNGYYQVLNNPDFISAKSWDDRVGTSLVCEAAMNVKEVNTEATIYFGGTVQEEVGCRGAKTVGQMVQPDISIAIDVYPCNDTSNDAPSDFKLGEGFGIGLMDSMSIGHTGLVKYVEDICAKHNIPFQETLITRGGTDSAELNLVGKGSVNINLCIPNRYVHTQRSIINRKDYDAALSFLTEFLKDINFDKFEEIKQDKQ